MCCVFWGVGDLCPVLELAVSGCLRLVCPIVPSGFPTTHFSRPLPPPLGGAALLRTGMHGLAVDVRELGEVWV